MTHEETVSSQPKLTWLVVWRSRSGAIHKRRFYTEWSATLFAETELGDVHPSQKEVREVRLA